MINLPDTLRSRPTYNGMPVPFFVAWFKDGKVVDEYIAGAKPDFRVVSEKNAARCISHGACWICGTTMGVYRTFVFGPLSAIHRTSVEPPSHLACAEYAVQVCPFMLDPGRVPRDCDLPSTTDVVVDPGILGANPGVSLLWTTKRYWPSRLDKRAITVGDPTRVRWWTKGRLATHAEAVAALNLTVEQDLARVRRTYFNAEAAPGYRAYVDAINTKLRSLHALLPQPNNDPIQAIARLPGRGLNPV